MPVVEVKATRAEDDRRKTQLLPPIVDDVPTKENLRPNVHFLSYTFGNTQEYFFT